MRPSSNHKALASATLAILATALLALAAQTRAEPRDAVFVFTSRDEGAYGAVIEGIRDSLAERGGGPPVVVHSLQGDPEGAGRAVARVRRETRAPIVTVGSAATRAALNADGKAPVVACMIFNGRDLAGRRDATGVVLEFPLKTQLEWARRIVPDGQSIGVLYNPEENRERIAKASKLARRLGLRLEAREVARPQALPEALESLARRADLLWGVSDEVVLSRQTAEAILLFSFRNRIPFAGLSASWVKAGALYALDRDYKDMGAQCGELAIAVRRGRSPSSLPPQTPRKVVYALNLKTAEHLKMSLPPDLVEGADKVFE